MCESVLGDTGGRRDFTGAPASGLHNHIKEEKYQQVTGLSQTHRFCPINNETSYLCPAVFFSIFLLFGYLGLFGYTVRTFSTDGEEKKLSKNVLLIHSVHATD